VNLTRRHALATTAALLGAAAVRGRALGDDLVPIRVGTVPADPGMQPMYALDQGFFKDAGLDASLTILGNASNIVAAIASGSIDVGQTSVSPVALARQHGIPIRFIAASGYYTGGTGNTIMMVSKNSTVATGADLNGKTIAVGILKDLTQFEASTWIDKTGGDAKTVRFIEAKYSEMPAVLDQGRADAAVLLEPYITEAKASSRVIANLSDTMGGTYMVSGWVCTEDWIHRNPDLVKRYIAVMQRSGAWANAHPRESAGVLVRYAKIAPDVAAAMHRLRYSEIATIDPITVQRPIDLLVKYGALAPLSAKDIIATA
jgi:NitT/TauT family transport system substrate-binding protein